MDASARATPSASCRSDPAGKEPVGGSNAIRRVPVHHRQHGRKDRAYRGRGHGRLVAGSGEGVTPPDLTRSGTAERHGAAKRPGLLPDRAGRQTGRSSPLNSGDPTGSCRRSSSTSSGPRSPVCGSGSTPWTGWAKATSSGPGAGRAKYGLKEYGVGTGPPFTPAAGRSSDWGYDAGTLEDGSPGAHRAVNRTAHRPPGGSYIRMPLRRAANVDSMGSDRAVLPPRRCCGVYGARS
jgi:hypothetical protein